LLRCSILTRCFTSAAGIIAFASVLLIGVAFHIEENSVSAILKHARAIQSALTEDANYMTRGIDASDGNSNVTWQEAVSVQQDDSLGAQGGEENKPDDPSESIPDENTGIPKQTLGEEILVQNSGSTSAMRIYSGTETSQASMCRIPNACVDTSGHVYVPNELQSLKNVLYTECRFTTSGMSFFDPASDPLMLDKGVTGHFPGEHILGSKMFRYHMPHMMEDFLAIVLPLAPFLQRKFGIGYGERSPPFLPPMTTVRCYEPTGNASGVPCASSPPPYISVLVEERARKLTWGAGLFQLLGPQTSGVTLQPMYSADVFPEVNRETIDASSRSGKPYPDRRACFGSVSVGVGATYLRGDFIPNPVNYFEKSVLFAHSGIQRRAPLIKPGTHCSLNVTIVNRPVTSGVPGFPDGSRNIPNSKDLLAALHKEGKRLGISVKVTERDDFGSIGIAKQFEVMQNAQILISVHGAELSNVLFLRRGVSVTEVYPFRYTPTIFIDMMRVLGLRHHMYIATPDTESYSNCIKYFNKVGSPTRNAAERIVGRFAERAADFLKAKGEDDKITLGAYWDNGSTVRNNRPCGRSQRLIVEPDVLAAQALRSYNQVCYGDKKKKQAMA
jgi:Glycosyltransferase 61